MAPAGDGTLVCRLGAFDVAEIAQHVAEAQRRLDVTARLGPRVGGLGQLRAPQLPVRLTQHDRRFGVPETVSLPVRIQSAV